MKVLFPGSFDPIHNGHLKIIERAARSFDDVVVLVAQNPQKKNSDIMKRVANVKKEVSNLKLDNVYVDFWNDQIMEYYEKHYFDLVIRSIRDASDLKWEELIASEYKKQNIDVDVVYFIAEKNYKNLKSNQNSIESNSSIFAFDLDGTLLNDEKKITWSNKRIFRKLQKNQHVPIIVTGRTPCQALKLCQELNFSGYIIGNNGASIYNIAKNEYAIDQNYIPVKDIELLIQKAYQLKRELIWTDGIKVHRVYFGNNPKKDIKDPAYFIGGSLNQSYDDWEKCKQTLNDGIIQISIKAESWQIKKIKRELKQKLSKKVHGLESSQVYYQVNSKKVDKFFAIQKMQKIYSIKNANTYAFGDSENDKMLIQNCGHGIAMGNARKSVKEIAKQIIDDNNHESIEDYLIKKGFVSE